MTPLPAQPVRDAIIHALPSTGAAHGSDPIPARFLYVPAPHVRALSPDNMVVLGIRGSGKTLWWQALRDDALRQRVIEASPRSGLQTTSRVRAGFGPAPNPDAYPDRDTIAHIVSRHAPRLLWRTVFLWAAADDATDLPELPAWSERVAWVAAHPEAVSRLLHALDQRHSARNQKVLVLFDALDRTAPEHGARMEVLRGLLELLIDVRELRALRAKAFLRPDMLDDPRVSAFPDASKLIADAVHLLWRPVDLYGLFFHYLGNALAPSGADHPGAAAFRGQTGEWTERHATWVQPVALGAEQRQQQAMDTLSGKWMGSNSRRGRIYTWLPKHLADSRKQASPRSFLVALHAAAQQTPPDHPLPLSWRAIRQGVVAASRIRRAEIIEDHPWVKHASTPLEGMSVPVDRAEILQRWTEHGVLEQIGALSPDHGTLPRHLDRGLPGLLQDLEDLGVFHTLFDGRVQIPDVYRISFGMLRKGGVPAVRS